MSYGITGYNGRINLYQQLEQLTETGAAKKSGPAQEGGASSPPKAPPLGADLSEAESRMIHDFFPESEQMKLRLYGPGRKAETMNPNAVGRRLDLRG